MEVALEVVPSRAAQLKFLVVAATAHWYFVLENLNEDDGVDGEVRCPKGEPKS